MIKIKGRKLTEKQKEIAKNIITTKQMYHIIDAGRQVGKSFLCSELLLFFGLNFKKWRCMYVSMTYPQTKKIYNEVKSMLSKTKLIKSTSTKDYTITLVNGTEILFRSYQKPDTIRGWDNDLLIIDEAAFLKDEDFYSIFRPTLNVRGKKCILCSTPKGKNYFYQMYRLGCQENNQRYFSYKATYRDNPYSNIEEIEDAKDKLPEKIFLSEYEAEFIDGSMSVFENYNNCLEGVNKNIIQGATYAAIDVGRQDDSTVLTIMRGNVVVKTFSIRHTSWANIYKEIANLCIKYKVKKVWVEVNGLGDVFYEGLQEVLPHSYQVAEWVTTNKSKQNIIEKLIEDFKEENLIIPNEPELLSQIENFGCSYSKKSRAIIYEAMNGGHDDYVMSLAICNYMRHEYERKGQYCFE